MKKAFAFIMLFIFLILSSCITPTSDVVVSPAMKSSQIKKIAVWRFRDGGEIANSGDIATSSIESALMEKGFGVVSYSQIREVLSVEIGYREGMALEAGMLTPKVLSRIYQDTGVDAIVIGSVSESRCDMGVPPCRFAVAFKMISTHSGELIVSANASDHEFSIERAALEMARTAVGQITKLR